MSRMPLLVLMPALTLAAPVFAQEEYSRVEAGGHLVRVIEADDFMRALEVDGNVMVADYQLLLDEPITVAGEAVLPGVIGSGGNVCSASSFALLLPKGQPAQVIGPIGECLALTLSHTDQAMRWSTTATPGNPAQVWDWTPSTGLVEGAPEAFQPKADQGWADLAALSDSHPIEMLGFAPVYAQLSTGLDPAAWEDVTRLLDGLGSGKAVAGGYSGGACDKFACEEEYARLWVDLASERAFVLWHTEGAETDMAYPLPMEDWPGWIRDEAAELAD